MKKMPVKHLIAVPSLSSPSPPQTERCWIFKSPSSWLWRSSNSREVLENNSCRLKWHFNILVLHDFPIKNVLNILLLHQELITVTDCCFQEDSNRKRQTCCMGKRRETNSAFTLGTDFSNTVLKRETSTSIELHARSRWLSFGAVPEFCRGFIPIYQTPISISQLCQEISAN